MFKKTIKHLSIGAILLVSAASANAGLTILKGTIGTCVGLCSVLSAVGNNLTANVLLPDVDGVYNGAALGAQPHAPNIAIEGQFNTLSFHSRLYGDAGALTMFPAPANTGVPTPTQAATNVTVSGGVASGILTVAGIGSTSGAPIWGIFDLDLGTFDSYLFTTDLNGDGDANDPGHLQLATGTFTAVPVPAAAWLMMSALVGLGGLRSRR